MAPESDQRSRSRPWLLSSYDEGKVILRQILRLRCHPELGGVRPKADSWPKQPLGANGGDCLCAQPPSVGAPCQRRSATAPYLLLERSNDELLASLVRRQSGSHETLLNRAELLSRQKCTGADSHASLPQAIPPTPHRRKPRHQFTLARIGHPSVYGSGPIGPFCLPPAFLGAPTPDRYRGYPTE